MVRRCPKLFDDVVIPRPKISSLFENDLRTKLEIPKTIVFNERFQKLKFGGISTGSVVDSLSVCMSNVSINNCSGQCMLDFDHEGDHMIYCYDCNKSHKIKEAASACNTKWFIECGHLAHCTDFQGHKTDHYFKCPQCEIEVEGDGRCVGLFRKDGCTGIYRCKLDVGHDIYHKFDCDCGMTHGSVAAIPLNDIIAAVFYNEYFKYAPISFTDIAEITNVSKSATRKVIHFLSTEGLFRITSGLENTILEHNSIDLRKKFVQMNTDYFQRLSYICV